jgi:signal transduction histidine kinase
MDGAARRSLRHLEIAYVALLALLVVLLVAEHAWLDRALGRLEADARLVNAAGWLRTLGQLSAKHAVMARVFPATGWHVLQAEAAGRRLERALDAVAEKPRFPSELRPLVRRQRARVGRLRRLVARVASGDADALLELEAASVGQLEAAEALVAALEARAEDKQAGVRELNVLLLLGSILVVGLIGELLSRPVLRRLRGALSRLEHAKREAESAADARARFAANVSHELRTPLNGILGMAGFLRRSELSAGQRRQAEVIMSSAEHLRALVDDILDFSKVQADAMRLERVEVDLAALVDHVVSEQMPEVAAKGIEVFVAVDPALDGTVEGDPLRLRQCLANYLSNAVKFTKEGFVGVDVQRGEGDEVRFEVWDSGPGVSPSRVAQIFEAFQQEDLSTTREHGGTGLGLAITRHLARLMGGDAGHAPRVGGGSRFFFSARLPPATPRRRALDVDGGVLLVGVELGHRRPLEAWLRAWGLRVEVLDAPEDLPGAGRHLGGVGAVIADGRRAAPGRLAGMFPETPCLVLTSPDRDPPSGDLPPHLQCAPRPVGRDRLLELLAPAPEARPEIDGLRVLLVEDNAINREVAVALLESLGCDVAVVEDGVEAVAVFEGGEAELDLVLMDWHMPRMDGPEATRRIRATAAGARVAIVALTAGSFEEARAPCFAAGMDDLLGKPIDEGRLHAVLADARRQRAGLSE